MLRARSRYAALLLAIACLAAACSSTNDDGAAGQKDGTTSTSAPTKSATPARAAAAKARPVPSAGCGSSTVRTVKRQKQTLDVAGIERWYLLSTPPAHNGRKPLPLVVEFHGLSEGAAVAAAMSNFDALGAKKGFVTAFPNGSGQPIRWDADLRSKPNQDFAFVTKLLDTLGRKLCIDTSRVYATGLSYGAIMSSSMACAQTERFAAIAPVSGITFPEGCEPTRRIPILTFHGTRDPILLFNGGVGDLTAALQGGAPKLPSTPIDLHGSGYPATVSRWARQNGCAARSKDRHVRPHVIERTYRCPKHADVVFMIIQGGGHSWPGSAFSASISKIVGPTTMEIDATSMIWSFLDQYHL